MLQRNLLLSRTARLQLSNSGCREDFIFVRSALFVEILYMLMKKRQETMCLSQKTVSTLVCRVTSLYIGLGNLKFSCTRWNSFKRHSWEEVLYPGHYSMQRDYRGSWEPEPEAPSQPLSVPGAILPKRPNSNVFKRENQEASMGWNEKIYYRSA